MPIREMNNHRKYNEIIYFDTVQSTFTVPSTLQPDPNISSNSAAGIWSGLGGFHNGSLDNKSLIQAGWGGYVSPSFTYRGGYLWYEIIGCADSHGPIDESPVAVMLSSAGDNVRVYVHFDGSNYTIGIRNITKGMVITPVVGTITWQEGDANLSAEFIVERPSDTMSLANFGTAHIWDNYYSDLGGQMTHLYDSGNDLVKCDISRGWLQESTATGWLNPSGTDGSSFQVLWKDW